MIFRGWFVLLFISMVNAYAQDMHFQHFSEKDGLSHNSVRHVLQDQTGFLWMGTFKGLNKFDGYEFKNFLSTDYPIENDDITALVFDSLANRLWIGTRKGLTRYDIKSQEWKTYMNEESNPSSLPDDEIRSVFIDRFRRVWVGTKSKGLFILDLQHQNFRPVPIEGFKYIKVIYRDKKGQIWIGSQQQGGIAKIRMDSRGEIVNIKTYELTSPETGIKNPYINFFYEDHKSDFFVGTRGGLFKRDNEKDDFFQLPVADEKLKKAIGPYFNCIARATNGYYWLGTIGGIIACETIEDISSGNVKRYHSLRSESEYSLAGNIVTELYFDSSGMLWIGTENGLDKVDPFENQFQYFNNPLKSPVDGNSRIVGFAETFDGKLLVAERNTGILAYNENQFQLLHSDNDNLSSIQTFDGKTFYCGLWSGDVLVYDYLNNAAKVLKTGFKGVPILSFCKLPSSSIMVGSFGDGIVEIAPLTHQIKKSALNELPLLQIFKSTVDDKGNLWLASNHGVLKHNIQTGETSQYVNTKNNESRILHRYVSDITIDNTGGIWATSRAGLHQYNPKIDDFEPLTQLKKLHGNWITDIQTTDDGQLWMNLNSNEIARYDIASEELTTYYANTGVKLDIFSFRGFYLSNNRKKLYMASKDGMIAFPTSNLLQNNASFTPFISTLQIHNKEVGVGQKINGQVILEEDINISQSLLLNYSNRNFSFTFSYPSYSNAENNTFAYKLEGFDEDWNKVDAKNRKAQYMNLFFGDYTLKVKATNSAGVPSHIATYHLKILPPFWLSTTAIVAYLIVFILIVYFTVVILRKQSRLRRELLLEKVKREKEELLTQEKLEFFTNISHEFRTPLSLIIGPTQQLLEDSFRLEHQEPNLNLIHQNANRLMNLVGQVMDFRKVEAGEEKLKVSNTKILPHTIKIFNLFSSLATDKKVSLNLFKEYEAIEGWIDVDKFDKILYNLLSNAIKHTQKNGKVDLYIGVEKNEYKSLVIEVSDTGVGIAEEEQQKIFSRFYQVKNDNSTSTGTGIGLSLVKSLVELHKAKIYLNSEIGKGSVFKVVIPIEKQAYDSHEIFECEISKQHESNIIAPSANQLLNANQLLHEVLIIEDNGELRGFMANYLSSYFKVKTAKNGLEGLKICEQSPPLVCISDVMMPEMNGFEFCKKLKSNKTTSHIPVILLTALSNVDSKINGYKLGADGYLVKPFEPSLLKTRIENIIKNREELKRKFSDVADVEVSSLAHSPADEEFINEMTGIIEKNIGNDGLNSTFLQKEMGLSSTKLYRKTKELTNMGSKEFIKIIRLKKAVRLLKSKKYTISEVSYMVGFSDPLYFSKCFKNQFGFSPSRLTKQQQL